MNALIHPMPVSAPFRSSGFLVLAALAALGFGFAMYRFIFGLGAATNLGDDYPWGLWKALNVAAGIAVAAGGFTTTAFVHVFRRSAFHAVARPALLAAALGYTFAVIGLIIDLGRYYSIWHPLLPSMWQGDSVLFEIAMCVMSYLTIMYLEFAPVVCEHIMQTEAGSRWSRLALAADRLLSQVLPFLLVAGVVISCLHQSSLGNLMLIAPGKMHSLWFTPVLSLLFLLSAIAVGFPVVIFTMLMTSWSLGRRPDIRLLADLARYAPPLIGLYLAAKVADLVIREQLGLLVAPGLRTVMFHLEMMGGLVIPLALLLSDGVRRNPRWLGAACMMVVLGVILNRLNVFLVAYEPLYAKRTYFPSTAEFAVSVGLIATLMLLYRVVVHYLPVFESTRQERLT